jgi:glycosyltransferase involved in cell wall biosynthesis
MNDPIKLMFVTDNLEYGGISRVLVNILNEIDISKFTPSLVLLTKRGRMATELKTEVKIECFERTRSRFAILDLINYFKNEKPNVVVAATDQGIIVATIALWLSRINARIVLTQHEHFTEMMLKRNWKPKVAKYYKLLMKICFKRADKVITVSNAVRHDLCKVLEKNKSQIVTIYNPIVSENISLLSNEDIDIVKFPWFSPDRSHKLIVSAGRLVTEKGFDWLIRSFSNIFGSIDAHLVILGEGPEQERLVGICKELGIEKHVHFIGFQLNPYKFFAKSDVFAIASLSEGFGNVIVEAMACGAPVIATDCKAGPNEIIHDGINGLLVPVKNELHMANALKRIMTDDKFKNFLILNGLNRARDFTVEMSIRKYEDELLNI